MKSQTAPHPLPSWTEFQPGEFEIRHWDVDLQLRPASPVDIFARIILATRRLIILNFPLARPAEGLMGRLCQRSIPPFLKRSIGRWNAVLDVGWEGMPEPKFGPVPVQPNATIPFAQALILGAQYAWLGPPGTAREIFGAIHSQWASLRPGL